MARAHVMIYFIFRTLLFGAAAATAEHQADSGQKQEFLDLVLQPSASKIEALTVHVVETPTCLDLTALEFSFLHPEEAQHGTITHVEYAVIRLSGSSPAAAAKTIAIDEGLGHCNAKGCNFTSNTDLVLENGVGVKVSARSDTYLWCYTDKEAPKHPGMYRNRPRFGNLIHNNALTAIYDSVKVQGIKKEKPSPDNGKIELTQSGYYVLLLANCREQFMNIDGHPIRVQGKLELKSRSEEVSEYASTSVSQSATRAQSASNNLSTQQELMPQQPTETPAFQAMLAPLILFGILGVVYLVMEKERRAIGQEDAYNASARNAGYKSLPMMDLSLNN